MTTVARLPDELTEDLHRLSAELGVPLGTLVLVAHAKVLAVLGGVDEVTSSYVTTPDESHVPFQLELGVRSWRSLVQAADRVESDLRLGIRTFGGSFDVELATGPDGAVVLRVHSRSEVLDEEAATRVLGYHLTALTAMVSDLDGRHDARGLVGPEETAWQVEALAGPRRPLPDVRVHELIAARATSDPDAIAAVEGDHTLTYRELDRRANQIGHALLAAGLCREDVVAVVAGRSLDWIAAVLGIFKAGGVYLPVEPNLPAERIATMLTQSRCRLVLTEPGMPALDRLAEDSPDVRRLDLRTIGGEHPGHAVDVDVDADQLAYIFFTSGSTGRPKGAMCDHAGMLNHLLAKIEDLGIVEGTVVAQTAPQCFDISLWQLIAGLLVGGRTLLVDDEAILDVDRFLETIVDGRVEVLQLVPSYLDVVLGRLEQCPRALPELRCVSVTGEAVPSTLVRRWFAAQPDIAMVNAYGLTETHDDTNHDVLCSAPPDDRIPLGRPVRNVHLYVVDDHLRPVPLGAPGEIVFSGVCVGRGYVNDPERTGVAFLADPLRPGERLYRSGDRGRWRPDGKLEFLGRADSQVKVRGFRIELGEVEAALARVPGVTDSAVVVAGAGGGPQLAGFFTGTGEPDQVRGRLADTLPAYMVPIMLRRLGRLPLTTNGKIDKGALRALADDHGLIHSAATPGVVLTSAEERVAAAWARVLDLPVHELRPDDDFFLRGGTSLTAVRLVAALDRAVTLRDVRRHPVLRDLALRLERCAMPTSQDSRPDERTRL